MATEKYLELCEEAQKKKLKLAKAQQKQISKIYNDMYINVCKKLSKADPKCLSKRYLEEMKKELEKEMIATNKKVINAIKKNMNQSSDLANKVQLDFFMFVNKDYDLNMKLTFSSMFSKIPKDAMNEILFGTAYKDRNGLSERIWMHTKKFEKDIDYIIAEGIANKRSAYDIAKDLEKYVNPNATKEWEWGKVYPKTNKKIDYNTQRLARTAVNHAFQQAQKRSCEKNPYVEGIKWLTSNSHSRTCQLCKDRAIQNDYNLGEGVYPIKDSPLDHPNGLCTTIPYIPISLEDIGSELRRWIDGENNPKLDDWFKKYGEEFDGVKKDDKTNKYSDTIIKKGSRLPYNAEPNAKYDLRNEDDNTIQRRYYDSNGNPKLDIDNTNHGNPKNHPNVPHAHDWSEKKRSKNSRDLTEKEKIDNNDLYESDKANKEDE